MRRQQLTEAQITALLDPPTDQRELIRHYTLTAADLAAIRRCRGDHNRLGHALMLCYLRYPGRPLKARERPPRPLLLFIADQIDALPGSIEDYLAAERNRQRHVAELQDRLGLRPFGTRPAAELADYMSSPSAYVSRNRKRRVIGLGHRPTAITILDGATPGLDHWPVGPLLFMPRRPVFPESLVDPAFRFCHARLAAIEAKVATIG